MREVDMKLIIETVENMCMEANYKLSSDIEDKIIESRKNERNELARNILDDMIENLEIADKKKMPICQDTGMAVFFIEIGRDIHLNGDIDAAINEGVRRGYKKGYLRNSIVEDPIIRNNTGDNTPAIIYYDFIEGDKINIKFAAKGFGSENMGALKMLKPSDGIEGIKEFVLDTVKKAGPNPCPPIVVGVGIGGTMDKACQLAKKALFRDINSNNKEKHIEEIERDLYKKINDLNIGPQGLSGDTTTLGVNIEIFPTHIAGLPVAVNINCHVSRHIEREI
ncbi:MAG: fumarate hydratase [Andreesenia angusta]|nr:fumarate hydratase [Andreesenia angusta]